MKLLQLFVAIGSVSAAIPDNSHPCDFDSISSEKPVGSDLERHGIGHFETFHLNPEFLLNKHHVHHRSRRGMDSSATSEPLKIALQAHGRTLNMQLAAAGSKLFPPNFEVHVVENDTVTIAKDFDTTVFYHGSLDGETSAISVHLDDGVLVGTVHVPDDDDYYIERADKYLDHPDFTNIIYKASDIVHHDEHSHVCDSYGNLIEKQREYEAEAAESGEARHRRQTGIYDPRKNTCAVALVADHKYMETYKNSDGSFRRNDAVRAMVSLLDGASLIYQSTEFDPFLNGSRTTGLVQFAANKVFLYTDESPANPYAKHASCTASDSCGSEIECAQPYLDILSEASPPNATVYGWDDFCLVHSFTYRDFCGGILGLAWVARPGSMAAGICSKYSGGRTLNTGISTGINFGSPVSRQVQTITLAHEIGHNFGSSHDSTSLSAGGESCAPGGVSGNYIMYLKATDGDDVNNDKFSQCSIDSISEVIRYNSDSCFEQRDSVQCGSKVLVDVGISGCGNGILDYNEDCDCSIEGVTDSCCNCDTCRISDGNQCSPVADPYCCNRNCTLKGFSLQETMRKYRHTLLESMRSANSEVASIDEINDILKIKFQGMEPCGEGDDCSLNRYCIADSLFVPYKGQERGSCPSLDWVVRHSDGVHAEPASEDQDVCYGFNNHSDCSSAVRCESLVPSCYDVLNNQTDFEDCYLFHGSDDTTCNNGANMCRYNGCTGSICNQYRREDSSVGVAEKCRLDDVSNACDVACIFNGSTTEPGPCISTKEFALHFPESTQKDLIEGSHVADGRTCTYGGDRYGGRCLSGVCQDMAVDDAQNVDISTVSRWMEGNWEIVLGILVGSIILAVALKLTYRRKKPQIKMLGGKMAKTIRKGMGMKETSTSSHKPIPATRPPATSRTHKELRSKMRREEAMNRLAAFFPETEPEELKKYLKLSRNEEEAVKKAVKAGNTFYLPAEVPLLLQ